MICFAHRRLASERVHNTMTAGTERNRTSEQLDWNNHFAGARFTRPCQRPATEMFFFLNFPHSSKLTWSFQLRGGAYIARHNSQVEESMIFELNSKLEIHGGSDTHAGLRLWLAVTSLALVMATPRLSHTTRVGGATEQQRALFARSKPLISCVSSLILSIRVL